MKKIVAIIQSWKSWWDCHEVVEWLIPPALLIAIGCGSFFLPPEKSFGNIKDTIIIVNDSLSIDTLKVDTLKITDTIK